MFCIFRAENDRFLRIALSEESRRKRRRTNKVNIQMTVLSWFLEFINGLVGLVIRFNTTNPYSDANLIVLIVFLDASIVNVTPHITTLSTESVYYRPHQTT